MARRRIVRVRKPSVAKALRAEIVELRARAEMAEQAAADQHTAMSKQDHVHSDQIAAIATKLDAYYALVDRLLVAWEQVLKRAGTP